MKTMALPTGKLKPSLGLVAQTVELTVTLAGLSQRGGLTVAGRLKAKTLRMLPPSQLVATPLATHAAGTPPEDELRGTGVGARAGQSTGFLQMLIAPAPVPSVKRPPNDGSKVTVMSLGTRTAERWTAVYGKRTCPMMAGLGPPTPATGWPGMLPICTQLPRPPMDPPILVICVASAPAPS